MLPVCRGLLAVLISLALVASGAMPPTAGMQRSDNGTGTATAAMASDSSMPGGCNQCVKPDRATHSCFTVCIAINALLPVTIVLPALAKTAPVALVGQRPRSSPSSPDPPPPRLIVLA